MAASEGNLNDARKWMHYQTIGHDKLNQLRHVRFFKDMDGMHEHEKACGNLRQSLNWYRRCWRRAWRTGDLVAGQSRRAAILSPFDSLDGCAKRIVSMAKEAGLVLTGAGATYPYGKDPKDCNIRIAPVFSDTRRARKGSGAVCNLCKAS